MYLDVMNTENHSMSNLVLFNGVKKDLDHRATRRSTMAHHHTNRTSQPWEESDGSHSPPAGAGIVRATTHTNTILPRKRRPGRSRGRGFDVHRGGRTRARARFCARAPSIATPTTAPPRPWRRDNPTERPFVLARSPPRPMRELSCSCDRNRADKLQCRVTA